MKQYSSDMKCLMTLRYRDKTIPDRTRYMMITLYFKHVHRIWGCSKHRCVYIYVHVYSWLYG